MSNQLSEIVVNMNIQIEVPNAVCGIWKVEDFSISKEDTWFENMRASFQPGARLIQSGEYKRLMRGREVIMSNTPSEIRDHLSCIRRAKNGGHILINGLGLGVVVAGILKSNTVTSVTIIERSKEVITLVAGSYTKDSRVRVICADAFEWKPPKGMRYHVVWHDIWDSICADNLKEMTRLHRKYGRRADWQGSWCKELCHRYSR